MADYLDEKWRPVPDLEGVYAVSDHGRVMRLERRDNTGRLLRQMVLKNITDRDGYKLVHLTKPRVKVTVWRVHILVTTVFIGPRPRSGMHCCHADGDPANNHVSNLRWGTVSENWEDRRRHKRDPLNRLINCPRKHPLSAPNLRRSATVATHRSCLACHRAWSYIQSRGLGGANTKAFQVVSDTYYRQITEDPSLRVTKYLDSLLSVERMVA